MLSATKELTIFAEIAHRDRLVTALALIEANHEGNSVFHPNELPATHFMRFVIIDDPELAPLLAWEINYDGSETDFLRAAARQPGIDDVFGCCRDYPGRGDEDLWLDWMRDRRVRAAAFYCAYPGVPSVEISNDLRVHEQLRTLADTHRADYARLPPHEVQRRLCDGVTTGDKTPIEDEDLRWFISRAIAILLGIPAALFVLVISIPYAIMLRAHEQADTDAFTGPNRPVYDSNSVAKFEDRIRQNQLTHVVDIKPGRFRMFTVRFVLLVIGVIARYFYVNGHLGGITSIHFARWVVVRDRRAVPRAQKRHRIVFFSNYDGSWESYLGEFIDRASLGLTAIWSNTKDFPPTTWLMLHGSKDEEAFKQWTRAHQIETQVWWSSVPESTVQNIRDDVYLRRRLAQTLDRKDMTEWLRRV